MRFPPTYRAATGASVGRPDSMEFCVVPVFIRISRRRSLLAAILVVMALSACGDGKVPPAAPEPRGNDTVSLIIPTAQEQDAAARHGLDGDTRAKPFLLQMRCRLSRCNLILRLKRSGLLRALLK